VRRTVNRHQSDGLGCEPALSIRRGLGTSCMTSVAYGSLARIPVTGPLSPTSTQAVPLVLGSPCNYGG
jgi:hypothetical protein